LIPVYPVANKVDNCNFSDKTQWERQLHEGATFAFSPNKAKGYQYIREATELHGIADSTYDFVLSSHCIEHLANPIKALHEWYRVLKPNGLLVIVFPHNVRTFDHLRPTTEMEHLRLDYKMDVGEEDETHFKEVLLQHDLSRDPWAGSRDEFETRVRNNAHNRCVHHHVFNSELAVQLVNECGFNVCAVEVFRPFHIVVVGQRK